MSQADTTASFGYWVRRQRLALDLTQAALADQVGCAAVTISKIERDERRPSRQMANLLADNLAIPAHERDRFIAAARGEQATARMPLTTQPLDSLSLADDSPHSNLPVSSTPFVGRRQELEHLLQRLMDPACRLLTLVGAGGFGKTRLAIRLGELALEAEELFPDGVFFVALDGLESSDLVVPAMAAALHFTFYDQENQERQLLNYLATKQLLLILDNAEQILDPALVDAILAHAPQVKIVVTSREALHLQQEWFHPIDGMAVEDVQTDDVEEHTAADAIQLFQQCARRARPDFDLDRELAHVQRICRLVDGAPLAIELAASWLKALPCAQVAQELERSLDFLSTSLRNLPARHRSMRLVLEQSYGHLTEEEQRVFRQLSVFAGGFRAEAAEQVAGASLRTLAALVEKSVVQLSEDGRYHIHALLRQLGAEKLADQPQERAAARARHCDFYMAFLHERRQAIAGPEQKRVLAEVQAEMENVRAAWGYAIRHDRWDDVRRALPTLFRFLWTRGRFEEGEWLMMQALDAVKAETPSAEQAELQIALAANWARFAGARGAHRRASDVIQDALVLAKEIESLPEQALCFYAAGMLAYHQGDGERAGENLRTAYEIYRELNDKAGIAETALRWGEAAYGLQGDLSTAQRLGEEGLQHFQEIGDRAKEAEALDQMAWMRCKIGEVDEAEKYYRESLALARDLGNPLVVAKSIGGLGLVAWARGQWDLAVRLMEERLERMESLGYENEVYGSLNFLCGVYVHAGRYTEAKQLMEAHPQMWRNFIAAQAHVGMGAYEEAMDYLPQETAEKLNIGHTYDLASYMIAWAMLLTSECPLIKQSKQSGEAVPLARAERMARAREILSVVRACNQCEILTRRRAERLLADLQGNDLTKAPDAAPDRDADRALEDLAREMLTIRLG